MSFNENLKKYRLKAGFKSAKRFADSLNIPYTTYMGYENKNSWPPEKILVKLANALSIDVNTLVGFRPLNERNKLLNTLRTAGILFEIAPDEGDGVLLNNIVTLDKREIDNDMVITISKDKGDSLNGDSLNDKGSIKASIFVSFDDLKEIIIETQKEFSESTSSIFKNIFSNRVFRFCIKNSSNKKNLKVKIFVSGKDSDTLYEKLFNESETDLNNKD